MRTKWMGVALAAGVVCGWADGANALAINAVGYYNYDDNGGSVNLTYDSKAPGLNNATVYDSISCLQYSNCSYFYSGGSIASAAATSTPDFISAYAHVVGATLVYNDGSFDDNGGYTLNDVAYDITINDYDGQYFTLQAGELNASGTPGGPFVPSVSVDIQVFVPLPASAPLFAAAILALGGATYARRRLSLSAQS